MRKTTILAAVLSAGMALGGAARADEFALTSADISPNGTIHNEQVFNSFGCSGQNISPRLAWSGAPANTKSFALTIYDPDAPTGSGFWHWVVFNIPANTTALAKNAGDVRHRRLPKGAMQSRTDYGLMGYGGPCPPAGDKPHHYVITLHALDVAKLPLDQNTSAAVVGFNLHFHTIASATLTGLYGH